MFGFVEHVGRVEKGFRGDAAYVEASATESTTTFDASNFETELSSFDGTDVATGTTTDDNDILKFMKSRENGWK
jgi:hypothetical protein